MAVGRNQNWLGNQRVDAPHLRALESGVSYDFDILAQMLTGEASVIAGFDVIRTGAAGNPAENLTVRVASASIIHYQATDSGSIFRVPADRANEVLGPTNARVAGSFVPGSTNFVGVDLRRRIDDSTADTVQIFRTASGEEEPALVPLARTMDYQFVISPTEFSATPGVCPVAIVTTDASNNVVTITDARQLMFRLGRGGSNPQSVSPFAWPGGRVESATGGDRSIFDLKSWMNGVMTRIWESGGGPNWYSQTSDRNVRMASNAVFSSTGEPFEWTGTNLHWRGLRFVFDNTPGYLNEIADQTVNHAGLTDLSDGECVYVDVDRGQNRTVAGVTALIAVKGVLATLGGGPTPGSRWVMAWRSGAFIYVRDQNFPVGSGLKVATALAAGTVLLTADPNVGPTVPHVPVVVNGFAVVDGLSHSSTGITNNQLPGAGDLTIGLGAVAGDHNVEILTSSSLYRTTVVGSATYSANQKAALCVRQLSNGGSTDVDHILDLDGFDDTIPGMAQAFTFENGGAVGLRSVPRDPVAPTPDATHPIRVKLYVGDNGLASPFKRDIVYLMWFDGTSTPLAQSPVY